jgi:hypothetical protein
MVIFGGVFPQPTPPPTSLHRQINQRRTKYPAPITSIIGL